jgi:CheY-like chemotaxis protein
MTARVLVVDDIAANVKLLDARLSAEYFEVRTAMSGAEADDLRARECDIVLLDVMMPDLDGFEVYRSSSQSGDAPHSGGDGISTSPPTGCAGSASSPSRCRTSP